MMTASCKQRIKQCGMLVAVPFKHNPVSIRCLPHLLQKEQNSQPTNWKQLLAAKCAQALAVIACEHCRAATHLAYVPADLLHQHLTVCCLGLNVPHTCKQVAYLAGGNTQILSARKAATAAALVACRTAA
jgi:hypothetical protein